MSLNKDSTVEDIYHFLKPIVKKDEILSKFKDERIKGNELFFLSKEDYDSLGFKFFSKLFNKLNEIKKTQIDILDFDVILNEQSTEDKINYFLKSEIKLEDGVIEKFKNINGKEFFSLKEKDLIDSNLKLGERKKIMKYISLYSLNEAINITNSSTTDEICLFLKKKFNLPDEIIQNFRDVEINGEQFFKIEKKDFEDFELNDEKKQKDILDFIEKNKNMAPQNIEKQKKILDETEKDEEEEEQINEEEAFNHFLLIDIIEYETSEDEINKCPYNKREEFAELCKYMKIDTKENCSKIDFDQASKYELKTATLWGTIDALFEFFEKRKMKKTLDYFKEKINSSGIYLLIKEDKTFAYIVIWPGKMTYLYRRMDEPQKDLLLSLVRIGFSLSNNNIISLTEKQQTEFDFQAINHFNSGGIFKPTVGEVTFKKKLEDFFKIEQDFEIHYQKDEMDGELEGIKANNSSIFLYISTKETINYEEYNKIPYNKLKFNINNICFNPDFNLKSYEFYYFLKKFDCFKDMIEKDTIYEVENIAKNKFNKIKDIYLYSLSKYIERIKNNNYNCEICNKKKGNNLYIISCITHSFHIAHENCINKKKTIIDINFNDYKQKIDDKNFSMQFNVVIFFFHTILIEKETNESLNQIIDKEIQALDNNGNNDYYVNHLTTLLDNLKDKINKNYKQIISEDQEMQKYNEMNIKWKKDIINKINNSFKSENDKMSIYYEFISSFYDEREKTYLFTFKKYIKNFSRGIVKLFTFYKYNNEKNYLLKNKESKEWNEDEFENYYIREKNNGILIKKSNENYVIEFTKGKKIIFNGCYDYNDKFKIFILSKLNKIEKGECIYVIYLNEENKIKNTKSDYLYFNEKLIKIQIVPFDYEDSSKYGLFYTKDSIDLINIGDFRNISCFDIKENYNKYKFNQLQFLIYEKFLLIFFFNEEYWDLDVYNISPDIGEFIKIIPEKQDFRFTDKNGKFSICQIKNVGILYFYYIENNELHIKLKKILTSVASFKIESNYDENSSEELNLTEGNCVINYFYHAFIKYPSIGALQYNYYNKKSSKNIYIYSSNLKEIQNYKDYFNELKSLCISERGLNYDDINYELKSIFNSKKIKNVINLGDLIIKFIEVVPLQIAKIKNYFFKAMSNGKDISIQDLYETYSKNIKDKNVQVSIQEYADYISFSMKNSIFNFYDLPVIVLAFMGSQSIGKSTLSNELVQSFFNVSGMRCTEGIWMAVALFKGIQLNKKCDKKCKYCSEGNDCILLFHNIDIKCICDNCCCNEKCILIEGEINIKCGQINCKERCSLPKGHKNTEYHICEISPYNHGFICVSLDFEGLGTFERSLEQDIDLAMVGAALANSIILRADKSFDVFMENRMFNWSEGSKNVNSTNSKHYYGGNIVFCQKDIPKHSVEEVRKEFEEKINTAISRWLMTEKKRNIRELNLKDFPVFGIFSKYINSPTPIFNKNEFHNTLRKELIHLIIKNVLLNRSYPNYRTGTEFMFYLQRILATVDIHDYNVLDSIAIDNLKNYLFENKIKAMEIFGIYYINKEKTYNTFDELEKDLISNLELLKYSYISNNKQEINELLNINIITNRKLKIGKEEIKYNDNIIILNIIENSTKEISSEKSNSYKLIIEGIKEFGFLLLIPSEYKEKFSLEDIRKNIFLLWETICKTINLSTIEIINNFELFIEEIIKRREDNIKKWLENLTSSFSNEEIGNIKEINSILRDRWKICKEKCFLCYYRCTKTLGHINEHNCGFDHKCHEKCQICELINCENYENCEHFCYNKESGHQDIHLCGHFHQCDKTCSFNYLRGCTQKCMFEFGHEGNCDCKSKHLCDKKCIYNDCSEGCKIQCNLPINHEEDHICESNDHQCIMECILKNKTIGCINEGKCKYKLPHSLGNHNCGGDHRCIEKCYLKELSKNCGNICSLPYEHNGKHICSEMHMCKEDCDYKEKTKGCKEKCVLNYGHELPHDCKEKHYCFEDCYYKDKSRNCHQHQKCILPYKHKEKCTCGAEHLCNKKCSIINCNNLCNLPFVHDGKLCNCKEFHKCQKFCCLKENSIENTCDKNCKMEIGHEGPCFCGKSIEEHKCNKICSSQDCNKNCSLNAYHKGLCICGECNCRFECKYKDISRNCHKKCVGIYGHEGEHQCEEKNHLCNKDCIYKDITREENGGCQNFCGLPAGHDELSNHLCNNPKEKHICKGICSLKNNSTIDSCYKLCNKYIEHKPPCFCQNSPENHICNKECYLKGIIGCKISCSLPTNHEKNGNQKCLCSVGEIGHLCGKPCSLFEKSRCGCNKNCILAYNHDNDRPCLCSASLEEHKCNKKCSFESESREGCAKLCNLKANHLEPCFCQNSPEIHICKKICCLKEKSLEGSCNDKCIKNAGHEGNCICTSKKHECKERCKYKDYTREGCLEKCSKEAGHEGEHICQKPINNHKCNQNCDLKEGSRMGCNNKCNKIPLHEGNHLCDSNDKHLCKERCDLIDKCSKGCLIFCSKMTGHKGNHDCNSEKHICKGICFLQNISRGCKSQCTLPYNHDNYCICSLEEDKHICKEKCKLCRGDTLCEYKYKHKEMYHLCNREHDCEEICNQEGYCEINTNTNIKEKPKKSYILRKTNEIVSYEEENQQTCKKKQCNLKIPKGKLTHNGKHKCQIERHKCGFKCQQCTRLCDLDYKHEGLHNCRHGHTKNATISTEETDIKLVYGENEYTFQEGETATIFTCTQYCRDQGRGHIHIVNLVNNSNLNDDIINKNIKKSKDNIYECKCKFFWESFLQFRFEDEFSKKLKEDFNKCPAKCLSCKEKGEMSYCELDLWHNPEEKFNKDGNYWISVDGHKFKCKHEIPCHTIFIIDKSGSMGNGDIKPKLQQLRSEYYFNCRLGSVIEHVFNYIKRRDDLNKEDIFSFVAFSDTAKIIFKQKKYNSGKEFNFIDTCIKEIEWYEGNTLFKEGLIKAKEILNETNRKKYRPIMILFSDGADENMNETNNIVKEVSIFIYNLILIII